MMVRQAPGHGTFGRYKGGKTFDPCRCQRCRVAYSSQRADEKAQTRARTDHPPAAAGSAHGPASRLPNPVGAEPCTAGAAPTGLTDAVRADIERSGLTGGRPALALVLAYAVETTTHQYLGPLARQLRDLLEDIAKATKGSDGDEFEALLAEFRAGPAPLPPALRDSPHP